MQSVKLEMVCVLIAANVANTKKTVESNAQGDTRETNHSHIDRNDW